MHCFKKKRNHFQESRQQSLTRYMYYNSSFIEKGLMKLQNKSTPVRPMNRNTETCFMGPKQWKVITVVNYKDGKLLI